MGCSISFKIGSENVYNFFGVIPLCRLLLWYYDCIKYTNNAVLDAFELAMTFALYLSS